MITTLFSVLLLGCLPKLYFKSTIEEKLFSCWVKIEKGSHGSGFRPSYADGKITQNKWCQWNNCEDRVTSVKKCGNSLNGAVLSIYVTKTLLSKPKPDQDLLIYICPIWIIPTYIENLRNMRENKKGWYRILNNECYKKILLYFLNVKFLKSRILTQGSNLFFFTLIFMLWAVAYIIVGHEIKF